VHGQLTGLGVRCGRKRVARLMRASGLVGVHARRRWRKGRPGAGHAPDLVQRNFDPTGADQLWAADVTQFAAGEGWLYLAAVIDLWSRRVIGWSSGNSATTQLVSQALVMAATRRAPHRRTIHHSDRGAAYTSLAFSQRITELELHQSLGKTGDCYDNAAVEAFFATLKRELAWIHHTERWRTKDQLRGALFDHIEDFYNPQRIQQRLGHRSPVDFEKAVS
jgi:putative transposase